MEILLCMLVYLLKKNHFFHDEFHLFRSCGPYLRKHYLGRSILYSWKELLPMNYQKSLFKLSWDLPSVSNS